MLRSTRGELRAGSSAYAWIVVAACLGTLPTQGATAQEATAQEATAQEATAQEATGQEATAQEATAQEATSQAEQAANAEPTMIRAATGAPSATPAAAPDEPGGELDPRATSGPPFGSRGAVHQSEPMAMRRVGQPDAIDPELPVALSFFASLGAVMSSSYDDAIRSHAFGQSSPTIAMDGSITYGVTRWLHLGGRLGTRGRGWIRRDGEFAMASGIDLLGIAHARLHLGPVIDIGIVLGGGVGMAALSVHRTTVLGVSPRLHGAVQFGFRLARGFHLFLRGAWDYFPWNDIDRYGSDVDLGGPFVGIGFEVKT